MQEAVRKYRRLLGDSRRRSDEMERKLKAALRDKEKAEKEVSHSSTKASSLEAENRLIREKNAGMESHVQQIAKDIDFMQEKINTLAAEKEAALKQLNSVNGSETAEVEQLKSRLKALEELNEESERERLSLQKEIDELRDSESGNLEVKELKETIANLYKKMHELQEQAALVNAGAPDFELQDKIAEQQAKIAQLEQDKELLNSHNEELKSEVAKYQFDPDLNSKVEELRNLQLVNEALENDNKLLQKSNEERANAEVQLHEEIANLNQIIAELKETHETGVKPAKEGTEDSSKVKELENEVKELKEEIEHMVREKRDADRNHEEEIAGILSSNDACVREIKAELEATARQLREKPEVPKEVLDEYEGRIAQSEAESKKLREEVKNIQGRSADLERQKEEEVEKLKEEMAEASKALANAKRDSATLDDTVASLHTKLATLEAEKRQLQAKCNELAKRIPHEDNSDYIKSLELKLYEYQNARKGNLYSGVPAELSPRRTSEVAMLKQSLKDIEVKLYEYDTLARNLSKLDQGLTLELDQICKKTKELMRATEERIRLFEHELASFESEKERYNEGVSNLDTLKRHSSQEATKLQEQVKILELQVYSLQTDKDEYRRKYEVKVEELRRVKTMAEKLKNDFERYKQRKNESGIKIALKIQEDAAKTSLEIETLRRRLEEKTVELDRANRLLEDKRNGELRHAGSNRLSENNDKPLEGEQALAEEDPTVSASLGRANNSQVGLKGAKGAEDNNEDS